MSQREHFDHEIEPERYELHQEAARALEMARREFLKTGAGGLIVLFALPAALSGQEPPGGRRGRRSGGERGPMQIGAWVHIGEDGAVTAYTGKVEVGQGSRTELSQAVAEELRVPIESVRLVMADTALVPDDGGTSGSQTTPSTVPRISRVAAAARELLIDLAAKEWKEDRKVLQAAGGRVMRPGGESLDYGKLTRGRKLVETVGESSPLTPATAWKVAGQPVPRVDGREFVTGRHRYASDLKLPGMLHGKVLRPAAFEATLVSLETKEAESLPGVVVARDGSFAGVAAPTELEASRALAALKAEWKTVPQPSGSDLFEILKKGQEGSGGRDGRGNQERGSIDAGLKAADFKLESTYTVAYIAHAPLEPRSALAEWKDGALTVWTGTQQPFRVRGELARALGVPEEKVRVIVPDTGAGYGGKHTGEAAVEAARLARAAGKPVKLVWTREEEFTWAYFRPAGVIEVKSGVAKDGAITAWEVHNYNSGSSALRPLYEIPNLKAEFHGSRSPLRQGSYRALAATANHFARESHVDELARLAGLDPLAIRRRNLKEPRLSAVLEAAAERFGWGKAKEPGRGYGIACGSEKASFVACCAEVSAKSGGKDAPEVKVERIVTAFECGAVINPDNLRNQIEGAVIMGLGGALFEAIRFQDGKVLNPRFSEYRVPRIDDVPPLETVILDRKDLPSVGAGETPIVCVAPAIANAIFDACGARLRSLPMLKVEA